jgi:integrase/recombinase XerD
MRATEITNLDFYHFRTKNGVIYIDVIGKGNKPRKVPLDGQNSIEAFENYKEVVSEYLKKYFPKKDIEDTPLLFSPITMVVDKKISRMSYYTLYKIVKQGVAKSVEIVKSFRVNPDDLSRKEKKVARLLNNVLPQPAKDGVISPHWFRHTYVTMLLENDVPLAVVKDLVGHADISTTNLYLEKIKEEKKHEHLSKLGHLQF